MLWIAVAHTELTPLGKKISLSSTPQNLGKFTFWPLFKLLFKRLWKISTFLCSHHQLTVHPALAHCTSPFLSLLTSHSIPENTLRSSEWINMHLDHLLNPQGIHCQKIPKEWRVSVYNFLFTISFLKYFSPNSHRTRMSPKEDCLPSVLHENSGFQTKLSYQKTKLLVYLVSIIEKYNIVC